MSRIAYVNGSYVPHRAATIGIDDRGFQFADGVYEVIEVHRGHLVDEQPHLDRLNRSLGELGLNSPLVPGALRGVIREVVRRNRVRDGMTYLQVTRGVAKRDHAFPDPPVAPSLVITAKAVDPAKSDAKAAAGVAVITLPDIRWKRPDIKSISLLPNVLAKQSAKEQGAIEAWLLDEEGYVTEGAASNAWIVTGQSRIVTHPPDRRILHGVTRLTLLKLIAEMGMMVEERRFSRDEALHAKEAFVTGATSLVLPVTSIDGHAVGDGKVGSVASRLRQRFHDIADYTPAGWLAR